jgi:histidyl-tRNA synthetase
MLPPGVTAVYDPLLVRGMGYYTGPIFEVTVDGYGFAIAGGGRYDKMIGKFAGQDVPAVGFSIGFERIVTILKDHAKAPEPIPGEPVAILVSGDVPQERKMEALVRARTLRAAGATVVVQPMQKNLRRQIEVLEHEGFRAFEKVR